jgi:hypothetical protein
MDSTGKTSDSGSIRIVTTGNILFYFQNEGFEVDSANGYIDINIYIKKDTIEGYPSMIFIITLISLITIILIKKMNIKTTH